MAERIIFEAPFLVISSTALRRSKTDIEDRETLWAVI